MISQDAGSRLIILTDVAIDEVYKVKFTPAVSICKVGSLLGHYSFCKLSSWALLSHLL